MRPSVIVLFCALASAGCGGGPCASPFNGHWVGTTLTDSITLEDDCAFHYEGADGCTSRGSSTAPIANQGAVKLSIDSSTGGACLPAGDYTCAYSASRTTLTFNCGFGTQSYSR